MKSKNIIILVVLLVVGVIAWAMYNKEDSRPSGNDSTNTTTENSDSAPVGEDGLVVEEVPNALKGELKASSDKRRGNYMLLLENSDRIIYLNTSRDYSSLVGKDVVVEIEGTMDDFRLVDIKSR